MFILVQLSEQTREILLKMGKSKKLQTFANLPYVCWISESL